MTSKLLSHIASASELLILNAEPQTELKTSRMESTANIGASVGIDPWGGWVLCTLKVSFEPKAFPPPQQDFLPTKKKQKHQQDSRCFYWQNEIEKPLLSV